MGLKFRELHAEEIECRPQTIRENGCSVLLYKDARCDMNILDECVGAERWQRSHAEHNGNLFCTVSIRMEDGTWVSKEDAGSPSNTEAQKGHSSDSFKRACVNWGIGRELYTSPFIWIRLNEGEASKDGNKFKLKSSVKFSVSHIKSERGKITELVIVDASGNERWKYASSGSAEEYITAAQADAIRSQLYDTFGDNWLNAFRHYFKLNTPEAIRADKYDSAMKLLDKVIRTNRNTSN